MASQVRRHVHGRANTGRAGAAHDEFASGSMSPAAASMSISHRRKSAADPSNRIQGHPRHGVFRIRSCLHFHAGEKVAQMHRRAKPEAVAEAPTDGGRRQNHRHRRPRHRRRRVGAQSQSARHARPGNQANQAAKPDYVDELGTPDYLPRLLAQSDFVVLLLASVPSTFNIIGEKELRADETERLFHQSHRRPRRRRKFARARA